MENDLISVIVSVYNGEATLKETLNSIIDQTYKHLEIILVNDGSTDNSLEILEKYKQKDSRVVVVNKPNGGLASGRNVGLKVTTGKYICFCDADDMYARDFVKIMHQNIVSDDVDWVSCNRIVFSGNKTFNKPFRLKSGIYEHCDLMDIVIDDGCMSGILVTSNCIKIYKHSIIKEHGIVFDESVITSQDCVFNLCYFLNTQRIKYIDDYIYLCRKSPFTNKKRFEEQDIFGPTEKAIVDICSNEIPNFKEQMRARKVFIALQSILIYSKKYDRKTAVNMTKKILNDKLLKDCYENIKMSELNIYKRVCVFLMRHKMAKTLCFVFIALNQ